MSETPSVMYLWGQVAGVLESCGAIPAHGSVLQQAAARPALLAPYLDPARMRASYKAAGRERLTTIIADIPPTDASFPHGVPLAEQSEYWLGYNAERMRWRGGRPRPDGNGDTLTERVMVRLTAEQEAHAREIGGGNAAAGLRIALDAYPAPQEDADA